MIKVEIELDGEKIRQDNKYDPEKVMNVFDDIFMKRNQPMLLEDGTCSFDLSTATVPKGSVFFGVASGEIYWAADKIYFTGYGDLDSLFNKQVTSKIGEYKYESTVK